MYQDVRKTGKGDRCYHHNEMSTEKLGRVLGIGLRVAGRMASEKLAAAPSVASAVSSGQKVARTARGVARATGGFLRPLRRAGGILWLQITGSFFLIFAAFFLQYLWKLRSSYPHGPAIHQFWFSAAAAVVFLYLGASSFWRASRR
jgi:hypothetical protein